MSRCRTPTPILRITPEDGRHDRRPVLPVATLAALVVLATLAGPALPVTTPATGPTSPDSPASLAAQQTTVERPVPVDSARGIETIGPELRSRLDVFEDVEGFVEARLFERDDGGTILEISFRRDGRLLRERRHLDEDVARSLRAHLVRRIDERGVGEGAAETATADEGAGEGSTTASTDESTEEIAQDPAPDTPEIEPGEPRVEPREATPDEGREPRDEPASSASAAPPGPDADRDADASTPRSPGRAGLLVGHTLLGLGFYGWALPEVLGLEGERARAATHLAAGGLSYLVPDRLTRGAPVGPEHRHMSLWGGTRGILYGHLAASAVTGDDRFGDRAHLTAALAASVAGSVLGYRAVEVEELDEGTALVWTSLADVGSLAGAGIAYAAGLYDDRTHRRTLDGPWPFHPVIVPETRPAHRRAPHLAVLAVAGAGLATGRWLGRRDSFSVGDAYALRSAVALGGQLALPVAELAVRGDGDDRAKRYAAGAVAGAAFGVAAGAEVLRGRTLDRRSGLLLNAGQVAGTAGALGLAWFLAPGGDDSAQLYATSAAVGGLVGLAVAYRHVGAGSGADATQDAAGDAVSANAAGRDRAGRDGVRIEWSPAAAVVGAATGSGAAGAPPLLRIRF